MGDLKTASIGEVPEAQEHGPILEPGNRRTDELHEPPPSGGVESDLDGCAHDLGLNAPEGAQDQFQILGMDEFEAGHADGAVERSAEQPLRSGIAPQNPARPAHHDDDIGELPEQPDQGGIVVRPRGQGRRVFRHVPAPLCHRRRHLPS